MTTSGKAMRSCFTLKEQLLRALDATFGQLHIDGVLPFDMPANDFQSEPAVRYFTVGAHKWTLADTFPPAHAKVLPMVLAPSNTLLPGQVVGQSDEAAAAGAAAAACAKAGAACAHGVDVVPFGRLGTGDRTRWNSLVFADKACNYAPRYAQTPLPQLEYTGSVLTSPLEVTGWPVVDVLMNFSCPYAAVFAYLEDVSPQGHATCVCCGAVAALQRGPRITLVRVCLCVYKRRHVTEGQLNASFTAYTTPELHAEDARLAEQAGGRAPYPLPGAFAGGFPGHPYVHAGFTRPCMCVCVTLPACRAQHPQLHSKQHHPRTAGGACSLALLIAAGVVPVRCGAPHPPHAATRGCGPLPRVLRMQEPLWTWRFAAHRIRH